jgi:hypothetical protein
VGQLVRGGTTTRKIELLVLNRKFYEDFSSLGLLPCD